MSLEEDKSQLKQLLHLTEALLEKDRELRQEFSIGDKFRFIRDKLRALHEMLEKSNKEFAPTETKTSVVPGAKDKLVYVYLYNAKGLNLKSWQSMLMPKLFYEYSVNRPIYAEQNHIDEFLRSRNEPVQHAYLTVAVHANDIISSASMKDAIDNPLIKVKEGSLHFNRLVAFTHNEQVYEMKGGELVKKT